MIRVRFKANLDDYRPVNWPVKHPYWCTGTDEQNSILIAYADDVAEIIANWPEATDLDIEQVEGYVFTDRFPKPDWLQECVYCGSPIHDGVCDLSPDGKHSYEPRRA